MDVISDLPTGTCKISDKVISPDLGELLAGETEQSSHSAESLGKSQPLSTFINKSLASVVSLQLQFFSPESGRGPAGVRVRVSHLYSVRNLGCILESSA